MFATRFFTAIALAATLVPVTGTVYGQLQANKPVRIVTSGIGGGTDLWRGC